MEQSLFEKMGGTYIKVGDYYVPDLGQFDDEKEESEDRPLGKYGMLRRTFLTEHRKVRYNHLVLSGKLYPHLYEVDEQAQDMLDTMMPQMMKLEGINEELKATNQLEWVGRVNNIKARVEEIIFADIVYK